MFKNYDELVDRLMLPIGEKVYVLPEVSAKDGLKLRLALDPKTTDKLSDDEFMLMLLGPQHERMVEDGVSENAIMRAAMVALADFQGNREAAEVMWETGANPKALKEWVAERTPKNREQKRSKSTGAASSTPRVASTNTTKTSRKN